MKIKNLILAALIIFSPMTGFAFEKPDGISHYLTVNESITFRIDKFYLQDNFYSYCYVMDGQLRNQTYDYEKYPYDKPIPDDAIMNIIPSPVKVQITTSNYCPRKEYIDYVQPSVRTLNSVGRTEFFIFGEYGDVKQRDEDYAYITFSILPTEGNLKPFIRIFCR